MRIYPRRGWSRAKLTAPRHTIGRNSRLVVHHTVGSYGVTAHSTLAQERAAMRAIDREHRQRGFVHGIGYGFVIFPSGRCHTGRGWYRVPAAAAFANTGNIHVSLVGNFETGTPTGAQIKTLRHFTRRFRRKTANRLRALGHFQANTIAIQFSNYNITACPGRKLKPHVRRLP